MEKMTQKDFYKEIKAMLKGEKANITVDEALEFIDGRVALLNKKSASKKPSKEQEANEALKEVVLNVLTAEGATVTDIMAKDEALKGLSNQKVSALLRMLVADGKVTKDVDGKKSVFRLA